MAGTQVFPQVRARNLEGVDVDLPDGFVGDRNIVAALAACHASADLGNRPVALADNEAASGRLFSWA